jgi:hypothetical protein
VSLKNAGGILREYQVTIPNDEYILASCYNRFLFKKRGYHCMIEKDAVQHLVGGDSASAEQIISTFSRGGMKM